MARIALVSDSSLSVTGDVELELLTHAKTKGFGLYCLHFQYLAGACIQSDLQKCC